MDEVIEFNYRKPQPKRNFIKFHAITPEGLIRELLGIDQVRHKAQRWLELAAERRQKAVSIDNRTSQ